jgi:hypothetical protein
MPSVADPQNTALRERALDIWESCGYTALSFTICLRRLRTIRWLALAAPVIFGGLATWQILASTSKTWAAVFALLTSIIPPAVEATGLSDAIADYARMAGEFTNLRDRFRTLADVGSLKSFADFEAEYNVAIDRLEAARAVSLSPPESCFIKAREKWQQGHYAPDER